MKLGRQIRNTLEVKLGRVDYLQSDGSGMMLTLLHLLT